MILDATANSFYSHLKLAQAAVNPVDSEVSDENPSSPLQVDTPELTGTIKAPEEKRQGVTLQNFLWNHDTHPLILFNLMSQKYGKEWLVWAPTSLWLILGRDFPSASLNILTKEKLNALKTLARVDSYWQDWEVFEKITQALNNNTVRFDIIQPPSLGQLYNSVVLASRVRKGMKFDEEIALYVASVAREEGVEYLPDQLNFAQKALGDAPQDVVERYNQLAKLTWDDAKLKETAADIQALKILSAQAYATFRHEQYVEQERTTSA